jgi:hypothetical protein
MKAVIFSLPFILFFVQDCIGQRFSSNLNAGITSSQVSGDAAYGFVQFGILLGGEVAYEINADWSLSFGIRFNQKGSRIYKSSNSVDTYRLRVNYIEAPLLVQYKLESLSFGLGPVLGLKVNQREQTQFGVEENPRAFDQLELGMEVNGRYVFTSRLSLGLLYQNSLFPVREHLIDQAFQPANFILGDWHQQWLNKGQFFSSLSLILIYKLEFD